MCAIIGIFYGFLFSFNYLPLEINLEGEVVKFDLDGRNVFTSHVK